MPDEADDKSENILTDRSHNFGNLESTSKVGARLREEQASIHKDQITSAFGEHRGPESSRRKTDPMNIDYTAAQKSISLMPSYPTFNNRESYTTSSLANFTKASATTVGYGVSKDEG